MKKSILLLLLFFAINLNATHIMSGQISVRSVGFIGGKLNYEITIKIYRDCLNGQASFDDPLKVGIFDSATDSLINYISINLVQKIGLGHYQNLCIEEGIYRKTIPIEQDCYITTSRCCRQGTILNLQSDLGNTIYTELKTSLQSSGTLSSNLIPIVVETSKTLSIDLSNPSALGDSITYEISTPFQGMDPRNPASDPISKPYYPMPYNPGYSLTNPLGSSNAISLNRNTGILLLTMNTIGTYNIGITFKLYKSGVVTYKQLSELSINSCQGCQAQQSIKVNEIKNRFEIFPNPAGSEISLHLETLKLNASLRFNIFNNEGRLVESNFWNGLDPIEINHLMKGIYHLQIISDEKIYSSKFLKL